jgi:hypothetical protein
LLRPGRAAPRLADPARVSTSAGPPLISSGPATPVRAAASWPALVGSAPPATALEARRVGAAGRHRAEPSSSHVAASAKVSRSGFSRPGWGGERFLHRAHSRRAHLAALGRPGRGPPSRGGAGAHRRLAARRGTVASANAREDHPTEAPVDPHSRCHAGADSNVPAPHQTGPKLGSRRGRERDPPRSALAVPSPRRPERSFGEARRPFAWRGAPLRERAPPPGREKSPRAAALSRLRNEHVQESSPPPASESKLWLDPSAPPAPGRAADDREDSP